MVIRTYSILFILFFSLLSCPQTLAKENFCHYLRYLASEKERLEINVDRNLLKVKLDDKGRFAIEDVIKPSNDALYIGIANDNNSGIHHYYIIANGVRYDAIPFHQSKVFTNALASKGALFELKVGRELVVELAELLKANSGTRYLTCLHGVCDILEQIDVLPQFIQDGERVATSRMLNDLSNAQIMVKGKPMAIEDVKLYLTNSRSSPMREIYHLMDMNDVADSRTLVVYSVITAAAGATVTAVTGTVTIIVYRLRE